MRLGVSVIISVWECNYVYMGVLLCIHGSVIMTMGVSSCEECNHDYMAL